MNFLRDLDMQIRAYIRQIGMSNKLLYEIPKGKVYIRLDFCRETSQGRIKAFHSFLPQQLEIDFFPSIVQTFNAVSSS